MFQIFVLLGALVYGAERTDVSRIVEAYTNVEYTPTSVKFDHPSVLEAKFPPKRMVLDIEMEPFTFHLELINRPISMNDGMTKIEWRYRGDMDHCYFSDSETGVKEELLHYVSLTFVEKRVGSFQASLSHNGVLFSLVPGKHHETFENYLAIGSVQGHNDDIDVHSVSDRRRLQLQVFTNCYPNQQASTGDKRGVDVGYIVDPAMTARMLRVARTATGTNAEKITLAVEKINSDSNAIYTPQMNVVLVTAKIVDQQGIFPEQVARGFTLGCKPDIGNYLEQLAQWRTVNKAQEFALWELLTDCYPPPGTVGIAYVGTLCRSYGVGVTTWTGDTTWKTNAHEIGHNFGARHSFEQGQGRTGGIMDYGDGLLGGVFQFNTLRKNEVCGTITNTMARSRIANCWKTLDNAETGEFRWVATGLGGCEPAKGQFRFRSTQYECRQGTTKVADEKCDLGLKPIQNNPDHVVQQCPAVAVNPTCGDGILEEGEACEPNVPAGNPCCTAACQWTTTGNCATQLNRIDGAFVYGTRMYQFRGDQILRFATQEASTVTNGYPRAITTLLPALRGTAFANNIDSATAVEESSILYLFQGMNYLAYDVSDHTIMNQGALTGLMPDLFVQCGTIEAAMVVDSEVWMFCQTMYTIVPFGNNQFTEFGPTADLDFTWPDNVKTGIQGAVHAMSTGASRFFNGGSFVDWEGRNVAGSGQIGAAAFTSANVASGSNQCRINCLTCNDDDECTECDEGYRVSDDGRCIEDDAIVTLNFRLDSNNLVDSRYIKGGKGKLDQLKADDKFEAGMKGVEDTTYALLFEDSDELEMVTLNQEFKETLTITANINPLPTANNLIQRFITMFDAQGNERLAISFKKKLPCQPPTGCTCKSPDADLSIPAKCAFHGEWINGQRLPYCYVNGFCATGNSSRYSGERVALCDDSECSDVTSANGGEQLELYIKLPSGKEFNCFVDAPMTVGQWNHVEFEISNEMFKTGVNGVFHRRGYNDIGVDVDNKFFMGEWKIGLAKEFHTGQEQGLAASIDSLRIQNMDGNANAVGGNDDDGSSSATVAIVVIVVLVLVLVAVGAYFKDEIKEYFEKDEELKMGDDSSIPTHVIPPSQPARPANPPPGNNNISRSNTLNPGGFDFSASRRESRAEQVTMQQEQNSMEDPHWYYVDHVSAQQGPVTEEALKQLYVQEIITQNTYVWHDEDMSNWEFLKDVDVLSWE